MREEGRVLVFVSQEREGRECSPLVSPNIISTTQRRRKKRHTDTDLLVWIMKTMFPIRKRYSRNKCIRERKNVKIYFMTDTLKKMFH